MTAPTLKALAAQPAPRRFPWLALGAIAGLVVVLLIGAGLFLRSRGAAPAPEPTTTPVPTATETLPPSVTPTPRPPTNTPAPTVSPSPANTAVPPTKYTVRSGDTLASIAERFDTTVERLQQFNSLSDDVIQVGQALLIPVSGSTPEPTNTPAPTTTFVPGPTPGTVLHVVQSGDTLLGISLKYGVSLGIIQKANDIRDAESIRAGQQLVIPIGPTGTPTVGPRATPTGIATYPAPALLAPLDGQTFEGDEETILLQWASVGILRQDEYYFVRLEQVGAGIPPSTWQTQATGWHIPIDQFPRPDDARRTFQWQVRVVRQTGTRADGTTIYTDAGLPSVIRSFRWLIAQPTPTPTPGPTQ